MNPNGDKIYKTIEQIPKQSEIPNLQEKKKKKSTSDMAPAQKKQTRHNNPHQPPYPLPKINKSP